MIRQEQIAIIIDAQKDVFFKKNAELTRNALKDIPIIDNYATIITGVRRCGKSTLLLQLLKQRYDDAIYFNFEDIRLVGFEAADFTRLHSEIVERNVRVLFFDEIQLIKKWEIFIHQLLREGFKVFVTGSNASLLSRELGTHLTGRHVTMELFPFSFPEYITFKGLDKNSDSIKAYLKAGGLPEFIKHEDPLVLTSLVEDILVRDIAVRHGVRDVSSLKELAVYLISNVGGLVSANKLIGMFGIKSSTTLLEFFAYFKDAYLVEFMPQFSYSLKAQSRNPKKIYTIDTGLISAVSIAFTDNFGRKLENMVYLHLRRRYTELYYFSEKGECDFIAYKNGKIEQAVQVCYHIDDINFEREYNGLLEALKFFRLHEGIIVTLDQKDTFEKEGFCIKLVPAVEYLLSI